MGQALRYVRDFVIPAVGPVEPVSVYRKPELNVCSGGAPGDHPSGGCCLGRTADTPRSPRQADRAAGNSLGTRSGGTPAAGERATRRTAAAALPAALGKGLVLR